MGYLSISSAVVERNMKFLVLFGLCLHLSWDDAVKIWFHEHNALVDSNPIEHLRDVLGEICSMILNLNDLHEIA